MKQYDYQACSLLGGIELAGVMMIKVLATLLCVCLPTESTCQILAKASRLDPPYATVIYSRDRDIELQLAQFEMMNRILKEPLFTPKSLEEFRTTKRTVTWQDPNGVRRVFGDAYCTGSDGADVKFFFFSCPSQAAYEYIVNRLLDSPVELVVHREGNYVMTEEAEYFEHKGTTQIYHKRGPGHVGYKNGVVLFGHPQVPNAPYDAIGDYVQTTAEADWAISIRPGVIPLSQRKKNLQGFAVEIGTQIQGRDSESQSATQIRASRLSAYRDLVNSFWLDVDSVDWKITEARPNRPYKARFKVVARSGSELASQFAGLQSRQPPGLASSDALVELSASFRVPRKYRSVLLPILEGSELGNSRTGAAIRDFLLEGDCRFQSKLAIDGDSLPILTGVVATPTVSLPAETLAAPFAKKPQTQTATIPWVIRHGDYRQPVVVNAEIDDNALRFSLAMNDHFARRPKITNNEPSITISSRTLFRCHGDLSSLGTLDEEHPIHGVIENIEHLLRQIRPGKLRKPREFRSLSRYIGSGDSDSDWSFEINARLVGTNRIVVEANVGAELLTLWRCRELLDGHRVAP